MAKIASPGIPHYLDTDSGELILDISSIILDDSSDVANLRIIGFTKTSQIVIGGQGDVLTVNFDDGVSASTRFKVDSDGAVWLEGAGGPDVEIHFGVSKLKFMNPSNQPVFEIDNTGALHGKTGQALTFDL
jgi:hypothetical protein